MDCTPPQQLPEVAFYYPGHVWFSSDWVKNLILFFDGIALLVPDYMKERPLDLDPVMTSGLAEHSLLHILEPELMVDKAATEKLVTAMTELIVSGELDQLVTEKTKFHELSRSRMGHYGDRGLADMLFEELKARGLARDSEDGVSIPLHPTIRAIILVILAQILRPYGSKVGLELSPATDKPVLIEALSELLSLPHAPSAGNVVSFDLMITGVDLSAIPIDEVLGFRQDHLQEHRAYARNVRRFVLELSSTPEPERWRAFNDRQAELDDMAQHLKAVSQKAWKRPASFGISIAGAALALVSGNYWGALFGAGGAVISALSGKESDAGAYSYLFQAQRQYY